MSALDAVNGVKKNASPGPLKKPSRRTFLIAGALLGGGLFVGSIAYALRDRDRLARVPAFRKNDKEFALNAWVKILPDGSVVVAVPHQEMGQGIHTGLATLLAEELDADWSRVRVEESPLDKVYGNYVMLGEGLPVSPEDKGLMATTLRWVAFKIGEGLGLLATGGSTSMRNAWEPMRLAGASARELLVATAARKWGVPAAECLTQSGAVMHPGSGRRFAYGDLASEAAQLPPPAQPRLKEAKDYRLIGKLLPRLDAPAKVYGAAQFGIDVRLPDMLYAAIAHCPVIGGTLKGYDEAKIKALAGVKAVVPLGNALAVVADSWWRARQALAQLPVQWEEGGNAQLDNKAIYGQYVRDMETGATTEYRSEGEIWPAMARSKQTVEAAYRVPFLAHATMEPMNCTALLKDGRCEVWAPNQSPTLVQMAAARSAGVDDDKVVVHSTLLGGGFGRRIETDFVTQAVSIAKALPGKPVKLLWSREEDMQHDMYRPAVIAKFRAGLDQAGQPLAWWNRITGPSVTRSFTDRTLPSGGMDFPPDKANADGAAELPYAIPNLLVEHTLSKTPVPVGFWRSVGHSYNAFFTESFIDEVALAAKQDPYQFRRSLLAKQPRLLKVLETAATKANWGRPLGIGRGRGIALHASFRSVVAQVAEVSLESSGEVKVHRVVCAIDCGLAVNPDIVVAQMESAIVFGLTAALYGEITVNKGRVEQGNFPSYEMLRLAQSPQIEVHLVPSDAPLGGVGEPGTPPIAPAVANALFAASGRRFRSLPLRMPPAALPAAAAPAAAGTAPAVPGTPPAAPVAAPPAGGKP